MKMGSVDLKVCQEGSGSIPYFQMGRGELMSQNQPEEMTKKVSSQGDQRMQLTKAEDLRSRVNIGGIQIFLPFAPEEAENCVASATTGRKKQSVVTVQEELVQMVKTAQEDKENEHSEEQLNDFSQGAEKKEVVALRLTAEEGEVDEEENEHFEEWLDIFSDEAENTTMWEFAATAEEVEDTDNIFFADLCQQIEALEKRVNMQGMRIQQVRLEIDEGSMGDHSDLPNCQKIFS
jgi:hypothetical protein